MFKGLLKKTQEAKPPISLPPSKEITEIKTLTQESPISKTKQYDNIWFSADAIREAVNVFKSFAQQDNIKSPNFLYLIVKISDEQWCYNSEDEFFIDYRKSPTHAIYQCEYKNNQQIEIVAFESTTEVKIQFNDRWKIESVFEVFEKYVESSRLPKPPPQTETKNLSKNKTYRAVRFSAEVLREAICVFDDIANRDQAYQCRLELEVEIDNVSWNYNSVEEFFSDYRRDISSAEFRKDYRNGNYMIYVQTEKDYTTVYVDAFTKKQIESVFEVFEKHVESSRLPEPPPKKPVVFIGHGRNNQWKELKDHLHEQHGHDVIAYEIGARAGHEIRDILQEMMDKSTIAFLVMTGEDETAEGELRARQNVIHETGLFQGKLGFSRGIVLLEEGVAEFSNIGGIDQIRFSKNNIKETFGDVLATIKREFK
jgi:predicted nucleotide-binding protein